MNEAVKIGIYFCVGVMAFSAGIWTEQFIEKPKSVDKDDFHPKDIGRLVILERSNWMDEKGNTYIYIKLETGERILIINGKGAIRLDKR